MKVARIEIACPNDMKSKVFMENGDYIEGLTFISSEASCGGLTKFKIEGFILPASTPHPDAGKVVIVTPPPRVTLRETLNQWWARVTA